MRRKAWEATASLVYKIGRGDSTRYGIRFSWTPEGEVIWDVDALEMMG